jgi:hypothetical protein
VYDAAVEVLKERTRDAKAFPLVFDELCNYGFRRNLWGHRPLGIGLSLSAIGGTVLLLIIAAGTTIPIAPAPLVTAGVLQLITLGGWALLVTPAWVRQAAFAYAERLVASAERLTP